MPTLERTFRYETITLWEASEETDTHGRNKVLSPVEITVRWDDTRTQSRDAQGNTVIWDVKLVAERKIAIGSYVREGRLRDVPNPPDNLHRVDSQNAVPDIKGRNVRYLNGAMRSKDKLPEIVS
jgi:hypothetical protein